MTSDKYRWFYISRLKIHLLSFTEAIYFNFSQLFVIPFYIIMTFCIHPILVLTHSVSFYYRSEHLKSVWPAVLTTIF